MLTREIAKHHFRRLLPLCGGLDALAAHTSVPRATLGSYSRDVGPEPPGSVMEAMVSLCGDAVYPALLSALRGETGGEALMQWRTRQALSYLNGDHDARFSEAQE